MHMAWCRVGESDVTEVLESVHTDEHEKTTYARGSNGDNGRGLTGWALLRHQREVYRQHGGAQSILHVPITRLQAPCCHLLLTQGKSSRAPSPCTLNRDSGADETPCQFFKCSWSRYSCNISLTLQVLARQPGWFYIGYHLI